MLSLTVAIVLFAVAMMLPIRLLSCLFSVRARESVRRRWLLHALWGVFSLGYLAFVVLSALAPQAYSVRAKIDEGIYFAGAVKEAVGDHWRRTGSLPGSNEEAGLPPPTAEGRGIVESIAVRPGGVVEIRFVGADRLPEEVRGQSITLEPRPEGDGLGWTCDGGDLPAKLRPRDCK